MIISSENGGKVALEGMHVCMYVCMYVHIYIYIYTHTHTHRHTHTHTYIFKCEEYKQYYVILEITLCIFQKKK